MNTFWKTYSWTSQVINSLKIVNQVNNDSTTGSPLANDTVIFITPDSLLKKCSVETLVVKNEYFIPDHLGAL